MGRSDAVQFNLEVAAEAKRLCPRIEIEYLSGWASRGNGQSADYEGGLWHHTAFKSSEGNPFPAQGTLVNGRPDLGGPLCNWAGPWCTLAKPKLIVVAAFPANHAGASGGAGTGPLPVTTLFNKRVLGLEIDYAGVTAMTDGQRLAAQVWGKAVANVLGRSVEYLRAHKETSITGKWDIGYASGRTEDMAQFRRETNLISPSTTAPITETPLPQEDTVRIAVTPDKTCWLIRELSVVATNNINEVSSLAKAYAVQVVAMTREEVQECINSASRASAALFAGFAKAMPVPDVDEAALARELAPLLDNADPFSDADIQRLIDETALKANDLADARARQRYTA